MYVGVLNVILVLCLELLVWCLFGCSFFGVDLSVVFTTQLWSINQTGADFLSDFNITIIGIC